MVNMEEFKKHVKTDYESPAYILLERVVAEMGKRGSDPHYIMGIHIPAAYDTAIDPDAAKYITVNTVSRHNGTAANVSVEIRAYVRTGRHTARHLCFAKVPKDASVKVINRRIDKVLEAMQEA